MRLPMHDHCWYQLRDINLAAALASYNEVEVHELAGSKYKDHQTGEEFTAFRFKDTPLLHELMAVWADPDIYAKFPDHPMAYMKAMMHHRNRYLDAIKQAGTWHMVKKGGRIHYLQRADA